MARARFWSSEYHTEPAPRRFGPRLSLSWVETAIFDGGCPRHPRRPTTPEAAILGLIFDCCACVSALHIVVSWWWGRYEWLGVWEWRWIARLHPNFERPCGAKELTR